jgi:hypothetical protein
MNVNVIVVNFPRNSWPLAHTSSRPETGAPVEEVIELLPQDGTWVGKRDMGSIRDTGYPGTRREARALNSTAPVMTYDQKGRVNTPSPDKGLNINITA